MTRQAQGSTAAQLVPAPSSAQFSPNGPSGQWQAVPPQHTVRRAQARLQTIPPPGCSLQCGASPPLVHPGLRAFLCLACSLNFWCPTCSLYSVVDMGTSPNLRTTSRRERNRLPAAS